MIVFKVEKQKLLGRAADFLMVPIMYFLQANFRELPQRTHYWNNNHISISSLKNLNHAFIKSFDADSDASKRWFYFLPIFYMPIFGGWSKYIVLTPKTVQKEWFIGWIVGDTAGVTKIPLSYSVRVLLGPTPTHFFGLNEKGEQIDIDMLGSGSIGSAPPKHQNIPLL